MGKYPAADAFVPEQISKTELDYYKKGQMGEEMGWGDTPAVVVVDMTDAFVNDEYVSGRTDTGEEAIAGNEVLLEAARSVDIPIFYTVLYGLDTVGERYLARDGKEMNKERKKVYEEGNNVTDALKPHEEDVVLEKPAPSAFFDTHLSSMLIENGIDTLIVTGMSTSGCVRSTVVDAASSNYNVIIPTECVADRCPTSHEISLFDMDMKWADVRPLDQVVETINERMATPASD
jgi:nicotinamidase-related amidase